MKRTVCTLLLILSFLATCITSGLAAGEIASSNYTYITTGEGVTITGCKDISGELRIPGTLSSRPVVAIGKEAFFNLDNVTSIIVPDSVLVLGEGAFRDCDNLQYIILPESVTTIEDYAFGACKSLHSFTIPKSVTSLGETAFEWLNGIEISVPEGSWAHQFMTDRGYPCVALPTWLN